ncbi:hypothetical protein ABE83_22330 [Streptomyces sp. CFMR 7]|nr:hypothetical protein ABE83_22330 [Streptomyces sp. CFMR 7]
MENSGPCGRAVPARRRPLPRAGDDSAIVFGWVNAAHQVGAALAAFLGGAARDAFGSYDPVWLLLGAACALAALVSLTIRRDSAHGYRSPSPSPSGASDRDQDRAPDQAHARVPSSKRRP